MKTNDILRNQVKMMPWLERELNNPEETQNEYIKQIMINYHKKKDNAIKLETMYIYLTFRCNLSCIYCWANHEQFTGVNTISCDLAKKAITEAIPLGINRVKLTGGEPLLFNGISDLVEFIQNNNLFLEIETNGTIENFELLERLKNKERVLLKVSLDSMNLEISEQLSGVPGSFERTIRFLNKLKETNIPFSVVTVANAYNREGLENIIAFTSHLGAISHRTILNVQPIGKGELVQNLSLSLQDVLRVLRNLWSLKLGTTLEFGSSHTTLPPAFMPIKHINFNSFCSWGTGLCGLMPNGEISICAPAFKSLSITAGNINHSSLSDIWNHSQLFGDIRRIEKIKGVCGKCIFLPVCRGLCRIFAFARYGCIDAPYPFCQEMYNAGLFPLHAIKE